MTPCSDPGEAGVGILSSEDDLPVLGSNNFPASIGDNDDVISKEECGEFFTILDGDEDGTQFVDGCEIEFNTIGFQVAIKDQITSAILSFTTTNAVSKLDKLKINGKFISFITYGVLADEKTVVSPQAVDFKVFQGHYRVAAFDSNGAGGEPATWEIFADGRMNVLIPPFSGNITTIAVDGTFEFGGIMITGGRIDFNADGTISGVINDYWGEGSFTGTKL